MRIGSGTESESVVRRGRGAEVGQGETFYLQNLRFLSRGLSSVQRRKTYEQEVYPCS